ncbi:hypothetical protein LCGC14_2227790 [marine sediment metagenome]|uniref:Uncharacterized protein n=1 Tax=marine sediment metagenome TaxID=412755 RepID=A0A0F9FLN1_9ZZZZ
MTTLDMALILEVESRIGPQVATVMKNNQGSMYLTEVAERIMDGLPSRTRDAAHADPWVAEQVQESIYRKVYKWVKSCKDVGHFIDSGQPVTHPTFGHIPDGSGKYLWFRVREVGDRELRSYEDHLHRKVRNAKLIAENIKSIRERLAGRLVRDIIRYDD